MFRLSKWYLDCITDSGDPTILYSGQAEWGRLKLSHSSILSGTEYVASWTTDLRPITTGSTVAVRSEALGVKAEWKATSPSLQRTVFESPDGAICWHCLAPAARVTLNDSRGFGYIEHLTMTIAPWKLPLKTLRWGRVASLTDSIIWIDWDETTRIVYRNSEEAVVTTLTDDRIDFADGAILSLDRSLTLRDGALGTTALSALTRVLPSRLLAVNECKWRSRALLTRPGRDPVGAWAIHERVTWPD